MTKSKKILTTLGLVVLAQISVPALAEDITHSTVAVAGYDVVSYQTGEKPVPGNGNHLTLHDGVTYLFQNESNKKAFDKNPERFVPAYGGYCAYGVSVGKKFVGDPTVWEIVDGRLYLNLDNKIKGLWSKDIPKNIVKANAEWPKIRTVPAAEI